jgi:hypothetical protein
MTLSSVVAMIERGKTAETAQQQARADEGQTMQHYALSLCSLPVVDKLRDLPPMFGPLLKLV